MSERPRRFTKVIDMLTSIEKDDSGRKSETEEGNVLDYQLCSSDEMNDDEKTEQFDDAQPIVHIGDLQTSDTNVEIYSAMCDAIMMILVRVLLKARARTRQQEMAQNGNLWNSV